MLEQVETLLILQDRDRKIVQLQQDLDRIPSEEDAAKTRLAADEKRAADAKAAVQENEVAMKNLELDIQTRQDSIKKLKVQQYETKKNEEFHRMGEEIENYGKEVTTLEDSELELMEKGESLQAAHSEAIEKLASTQKLVDEELTALADRRKNCESQIAGLNTERTGIAEKVDGDTLDTYNRLFIGKNGIAVVPLEDGQCKGCHMKVIKSTEMSARAEKTLTHCENCGRVVYAHG